jgi:hypothetical protein
VGVGLASRTTMDYGPSIIEGNRALISYIRSIVRETVDLSLGQQFQSETPGTSVFTTLEDMTAAEFQEALDIDSNNVAARVQMHTHSKTCTKYQTKHPSLRVKTKSAPIVRWQPSCGGYGGRRSLVRFKREEVDSGFKVLKFQP